MPGLGKILQEDGVGRLETRVSHALSDELTSGVSDQPTTCTQGRSGSAVLCLDSALDNVNPVNDEQKLRR